MSHGARTFIPAILAVCKYLLAYFGKNAKTLEKYMGEGLYQVLVFVVGLCEVIATLISLGKDVVENWDDFTQVTTLPPTQVNQIRAAWVKFCTAVGIDPNGN